MIKLKYEELKKMQPELVLVTPEMAKEWLGLNKDNRKLQKMNIGNMAYDMANGNWAEACPDGAICFSTDGRLLNGQHRLWAIIKSNTAHYLWVSWGVPSEYFEAFDNGKSRRTCDFIEGKNATICASVSKTISIVERNPDRTFSSLIGNGNGGSGTYATRAAVLNEFRTKEEKIRPLVSLGTKMRAHIGFFPPTVYTLSLWAMSVTHSTEDAEAFSNEFCSLMPTNITIASLKNLFTKVNASDTDARKKNNVWIYGTLLQAFECYMNGVETTMLNRGATYAKKYDNMISKALKAEVIEK